MMVTCLMKIDKAFRCRTYVDLWRSVSVTYMHTFPILITIRISVKQTEKHFVHVDSESVTHKLAVSLQLYR